MAAQQTVRHSNTRLVTVVRNGPSAGTYSDGRTLVSAAQRSEKYTHGQSFYPIVMIMMRVYVLHLCHIIVSEPSKRIDKAATSTTPTSSMRMMICDGDDGIRIMNADTNYADHKCDALRFGIRMCAQTPSQIVLRCVVVCAVELQTDRIGCVQQTFAIAGAQCKYHAAYRRVLCDMRATCIGDDTSISGSSMYTYGNGIALWLSCAQYPHH